MNMVQTYVSSHFLTTNKIETKTNIKLTKHISMQYLIRGST